MASPVPAKSQPLHNFDLPRTLKWNKDTNSNTNHHRRRSIKSPNNNNPSPVRHDSPSTRSDSVTRSPTRSDSVARNNQSKNPTFLKSERFRVKSEKPKNRDLKKSSKILIKIGKNNDNDVVKVKHEVEEEEKERCGVVKKEVFEDEFADEEAKTWNLRPRKPIRKSLNLNGSGINEKNNSNVVVEKSGKVQVQSPVKKSGENEEKEKIRHSVDVTLTKEEIEEDIYAFTGSKPSRRPKKRGKLAQKQVDFVFPGMWLMSITPDSYKVSENSLKG